MITGARFELTDDFRNGFIDSLRVEQSHRPAGRPVTQTCFSAPRAERIEGETDGVRARHLHRLRALQASNPERPPLWQVKAARIIHNNEERTIYYENATLEFCRHADRLHALFLDAGPDGEAQDRVPHAALHRLELARHGRRRCPSSATSRRTTTSRRADLPASRQGVLGQAEWRHRLLNGSYNIRAAGIFQQDPSAFLRLAARRAATATSAARSNRPACSTSTSAGDGAGTSPLLTDKWFLTNYRIKQRERPAASTLKESISTALPARARATAPGSTCAATISRACRATTGRSSCRSCIRCSTTTSASTARGRSAARSRFNVNLTSLSRRGDAFPQIMPTPGFPSPNFGCSTASRAMTASTRPARCSSAEPASCAASPARFTRALDASCPGGASSSTTPARSGRPSPTLRADGFWNQHRRRRLLRTADHATSSAPTTSSSAASCRRSGSNTAIPFVGETGSWGTHVVEPIAQVDRAAEREPHRAPAERGRAEPRLRRHPIFDWDKFSGYDRVEGGVRANLGAQYTLHRAQRLLRQRAVRPVLSARRPQLLPPGRHRSMSAAIPGLESQALGLRRRASRSSRTRTFSFSTRARFDESDFAPPALRGAGARPTSTRGCRSAPT